MAKNLEELSEKIIGEMGEKEELIKQTIRIRTKREGNLFNI